MSGNGIGYRKRFVYMSFGRFVLIVGWGNFGQFMDAFELERRVECRSCDEGPGMVA